jgi:hypothetical protein
MLLCLGLSAGCAGTQTGAHFDGHPEPSLVAAEQIRDVQSLPTGYDDIGDVRAHCTHYQGMYPPDGAKLSDVDCGGARLTQALRERAAEVGGELLVGRRCSSRVLRESDAGTVYSVSCAAGVARPDDETRGSRPLRHRAQNEDPAPRADEGWRIRVRFARNPRAARRSPRRVDHVRQVPAPPVSHQQLGDIVTECRSGCSRAGAEQAVLVAAGRFGASDVAELSCTRRGGGFLCHGKALAHEVDPETNPEAR